MVLLVLLQKRAEDFPVRYSVQEDFFYKLDYNVRWRKLEFDVYLSILE